MRGRGGPSRLLVEGLGVAVGGAALVSDISYRVEAGEICAIVGASASGKSVHASAVLGAVAANAHVTGTVRIDGLDVARVPVAQRRPRLVAHVGQDSSTTFNPLRPVTQQIHEVLRARGLPRAAVELEWNTLVEQLGLQRIAGLAQRTVGDLSGGQLQRLAFAYACAGDSAVTVLDEPTTALDAPSQRELMGLLPVLRARGSAVLFITHDLALAAEVADHLLVFDNGRLVADVPHGSGWNGALEGAAGELVAAARGRERVLSAATTVSAAAGVASARAEAGVASARAEAGAAASLRPSASPRLAASTQQGDAQPILALDRVSVVTRAGEVIVDGIDLEVRPGQRIGVLGASGAGKTTLLRVLMGAIEASEGRVLLHGRPVRRPSARARLERARTAQYVPQHAAASLPPGRDVQSIIMQPARDLRGRGEATDRRARELADQVGLPTRVLGLQADELSGGQSQRVCLARALAARPQVLLADEPTSSLDLMSRQRTLGLLRRVSDELGIALVFVTHDSAAVAELCDELLVLAHGRVVERGTAAASLARPASPELRALIDSAPRLREV